VGIATGTGPIRLAGLAAEGREDAVAVATRLLAANARYGTAVIIAEELRRVAGARIHVRELDRMAARGAPAGTIHELLRAAPELGAGPSWVALYEAGLAAYRGGDWAGAQSLLQMLLAIRGHDRPAMLLIERCRRRLAAAQGQPGGYARRVSPP
jgi:adenylate cyclase